MKILVVASLFFLGGCSSWMSGLKASIMGDDGAATAAAAAAAEKKKQRSLASIAAPAEEKPSASRKADPFDATGPYTEGSLWNGDSQDNFYFSKNVLHKVGDILIVKMEPDVSDALNQKIASILGRNSVQQVVADEAGKAAGAAAANAVGNATGNQNIGKAVGAAAADRTVAAIDEGTPHYIDVDEMSVRITEILPRSSYRIEGTKRVFVKNNPYTLRYFGVVRDEDIGSSSMLVSSKVIDSKLEMTK